MAEYIEREALISRLKKVCVTDDVFGMGMQTGIEHAINCTKEAPTADVVEVVRCRDCTHWSEKIGMCLYCYGLHYNAINSSKENGFCSYGERQTE